MIGAITIRAGAVLGTLLVATFAHGQWSAFEVRGSKIPPVSQGAEPVMGQVVREIHDPHFGTRWILTRDSICPAGPGRLEPVAGMKATVKRHEPVLPPQRRLIVIRTGDRLIVQEDTAVVKVRLEAVALNPAVAGAPLKVRLKIGGVVAWAVAMAPGHAVFKREAEMRP